MTLETAVIMLQSVNDERREDAAYALWTHAHLNDAMKVAIREAGAIPLLIELLKSGSADTRRSAASALENIAHANAENTALIVEAGGIPPLLALVEADGSVNAGLMSVEALRMLAHNNEDNAVAIALARGRVEAIVELARRGSVTIGTRFRNRPFAFVAVVQNAGAGAKRKAALVVATFFRDCLEFPVPYDIKTAIASYLY